MPGWYDIKQFGNLNGEQDETGILKSRDYFHGLIKQEVDGGIPEDRIVIGGFSQGGAMSLITGITSSKKLGGIFGLSCYLLLHDKVGDLIPVDNPNKDTPIYMGHGANDPLILPMWGELTAKRLRELGWKVDLKMYPYVYFCSIALKCSSLTPFCSGLQHSAALEEIDDLEIYLKERIPPLGEKASGL